MTNSENLENMNAEVQTDEEEKAAVVVDIPENIDDEKNTDTNRFNSDEKDETDENESEESGMSRREKIILIIIAILLLLLLFWGGLALYNGTQRSGGDARNVNSTQSTLAADQDEQTTTPSETEGSNADTAWNLSGRNSGNISGGGSSGGNTAAKPDNTGNNLGSNSGNTGKDITPSTTDPVVKETKPTEESKDTSTTAPSNDKPNNDKPSNDDKKDDDTAPDYAGEVKVHISKVNDDTGVITVSVEGNSIAVPVQTTLFNGRVTKSGVAQGKIFGYNTGVTVLLFYPEAEGFDYTDAEVNGYMNRTSDSLTVLVDINGNGKKLLIKFNGMKSIF